ncbi:putative breast cancer metastasis-suppressor 1-like protein [Apostichopus japonicus]|uniref:Putative breast cancer metastasis-suppressor 1-like protein n=1 Tax=Stichopus japonicus TaxID=307972 RepID=A0A2G8LMP0_STIJA|nr:putative breast cancer metastasis-suppressor 1-like protein [Apostichopus japonicus]
MQSNGRECAESDGEEMEVDHSSSESDKSDDEESESGSSGSEDSSEYNEGVSESRRLECLDFMNELEHQFNSLRDQLLLEKKLQTELKLEQIRREDGEEYIKPLDCLEQMKKKRLEIANILRELRQKNISNKYDCETKASREHLESEKRLVREALKADLEDKVRKLEEDRDNIDLTTEIWNHNQNLKDKGKKTDSQSSDRKKKPVSVSDILVKINRNTFNQVSIVIVAVKGTQAEIKHDKNHHSVRFVEGKLQYNGKWFHRKDRVLVRVKDESATKATITSINSWEVWIKKGDGLKFKVHLSSLEQGKATIKHIGS